MRRLTNITLAHVNVRGIKSKIKDIISLAEDHKFDIMVFTETKLSEKENKIIPGYKNRRLNRQTKAGGVIIYYKEELQVKVIKKNKECETLWVKLECNGNPIVIGGVYSPCENNVSKRIINDFVRELEKDYVEIKENVTDDIIIVGDLNAHIGNDDEGVKGNNEHVGINGQEYRRFIKERQIKLINNTDKAEGKWTRVEGEKKSILDLTLSSTEMELKISKLKIDEEHKYSIESKRSKTDHNLSVVDIDTSAIREKELKRESVSCNNDWDKYKEVLNNELSKYGEQCSYQNMEKSIQKAGKEVMVKRYKKQKKQILGYNEEIRMAIRVRRSRCSEWKKEKDPIKKEDLEKRYKEQKRLVVEMMDETEGKEISRIIDETGKEKLDFWKVMKRIKNKKQLTKKIRKEDGEITDNIEEILNEKRNYFKNLYSKPEQNKTELEEESRKLKAIFKAMKEGNDLDMNKMITIEEIEVNIDRSKDKKTPGPDEIINEMLKEGKDDIKKLLCKLMNGMKEKTVDIPRNWKLGDLISFYKGKGDSLDMVCQRGITLTSTILKLLESIIGKRIEPVISRCCTPLQGGGKAGEAAEEYIFMIQTVIDSNRNEGKASKLIITDVEKAFDQAWRIGVFYNLVKRGVKGEILDLLWRLNNGIIARIKHDTQNHSEEFEVEESIRQGGGLSAIFYGQHVGCVVEDLEKKNFGKQIGDVKIPAVAWQDDVTLIPKDKKEESDMITEFEHSTDENRIKLAIKKKTKVLTVGKADHEITVMKGKVLTETEEAKVLGYTYNNKGNANTHLDNKESEAVSMMANMGLSVSETNMDRIYLPSLLIIHKKCFIHKLLYGLAGIPLTKQCWEKLEIIDRKVLRSFLNLPSSAPVVGLYIEYGIIPIKYKLYKRKLRMWKRINRDETNNVIRQCKIEQINKELPWFKELVRIANELDIDLDEAKLVSRNMWKRMINMKVISRVKVDFLEGMGNLKRYSNNAKDEISPGHAKHYCTLTQRKAKVWMRTRLDLLDPAPRRPYRTNNIWNCKFCEVNDQSTEHYVVNCSGVAENFNGIDRKRLFKHIQTLEMNDTEFKEATKALESLYKLLTK